MSFIRRFVHSPMAVTASAAVGKVLIFFSISTLSHALDKSEYGTFSLIFMLVSIGQFFSGVSLHEASLRFSLMHESYKDRLEIYNNSFSTSIAISVLFFVVAFIISILIIGYSNVFLILLFMLVFNQVYLYCISYVRLVENNVDYQFLLFTPSFLALIFSCMLMFDLINVTAFILMYTLVYFLPAVLYLNKKDAHSLKLSFGKFYFDKEKLKFGATVSFTNLVSQLTLVSDSFIVSSFRSIESFSDYRNATLIAISVLFIPSVFCSAYYAKIARATSKKDIFHIYLGIVKFTFPIAILISLPIIFYSEFIVGFVFGDKYVKSVSPIMEVTSYIILISFLIRTPVGNILQARGLVSFNFKLSVFGLAFNFVFSVLALIYFSMVYVVWVSFFTSLFISVVAVLYLFMGKGVVEQSQLSTMSERGSA